jgi:hypothetical protein
VRGSSFSVILFGFPAIGGPEKWAGDVCLIFRSLLAVRQAGARILEQRLML